MRGRLVILSGPSGCGKDTIINAWRERNPRVRRVVAYTTRPPREGEKGGIDYHFVTPDRFREMVAAGAFLEWKEVHGNLYGTPIKDLERMLEDGLIAVLKIDVQGAATAMEKRPDALSIFLLPPSMDELERRIRSRESDSEEQIEVRLKNSRWEMSLGYRYRHCVVNDDVCRAVDEIEAILALGGGA